MTSRPVRTCFCQVGLDQLFQLKYSIGRPWSHPEVLNTRRLDWESCTLTTRPLLHISSEDGGIAGKIPPSLKKMVVLPVKFTILISWSPICIPLILLSVLMRLKSTSAAVLYNNLDS